jgi:signal transduction histidine kinase/ABC-type amino acid transport substrate-binding protein
MHSVAIRLLPVIALLAVCLLAAPPSADAAANLGRPVIVAVYDNPPLSFKHESGRWTGVFPDALNAIAGQEGWALTYSEMPFEEAIERLGRAEIDMLLVVADTPVRRETMVFAESTFATNWGVVSVPKGSVIQGLPDLTGATVAVNSSDVYYEGDNGLRDVLTSLHLDVIYKEYPSYRETLEAVSRGDADAGLTSRLFAQVSNEELGLTQSAIMLRPTRLSIVFPPDGELTPALKSGVDSVFSEWAREGNSPLDSAIQKHVYGERAPSIPGWLPWTLGALTIGLALVFAVALFLRGQVRHRTSELRETTAQLQQLIDSIPDTYIRLDHEGRVLEARPGPGQKLVLLSGPGGLVGSRLAEVAPAHLRAMVRHTLDEVIATGTSTSDYVPFPEKPSVWREMRAIDTGAGEILMLIRDVSEAKRLNELEYDHRLTLEREVEKRSAEIVVANAQLHNLVDELQSTGLARDLFLANVSHELRTPLNSILGFTSVLLQGLAGDLNDEQRKQLDMVQRSGKRLAALVEDVLLLEQFNTDLMTVTIEEFSVQESLSQVMDELRPLADVRGLSLTLESPVEIPPCRTDKRLLERFFVKLIGNSIKFTESGGVTVKADLISDDVLEITVSDTGMGIPADYLERIFEEFMQAPSPESVKPTGTGLGLPISRRIARRLGGDITVTSEPGVGSAFTITLLHSCESTEEA